MKTIRAIFISGLLLLFSLSITTAQDDTIPYPPITPDNASQLEMIQVLSKGTPRDFSWSPNGTQLAITATGGTWIYDMTDENMPSYWVKDHDFSPRIVYAPRHNIYVSFDSVYDCPWGDCPYGQKIFVRDATTNEILHEIGDAYSTIVEFSPDGKFLAVATYFGDIRIWQTATFLTHKTGNPDNFMQCHVGVESSPIDIIFSPDSSWFTYTGFDPAMASPDDRTVWIWDTRTCELKLEQLVYNIDSDINALYASLVSNSSDGRYLLVPYISDSTDWEVYLWDTLTWENLGAIPNSKYLRLSQFSADGKTILLLDEGIVKVWDIESHKIVKEYQADNVSYQDEDSFSITTQPLEDGSLIITRGNRFYSIKEIAKQPFISYDIPIENILNQQVNLNDGNFIGISNPERYLTHLTEEITFSEYKYSVDWFMVSPDNQWLISNHYNVDNRDEQEIILWNLETGAVVKTWASRLAVPRFTSFSPDNKTLLLVTGAEIIILNLETLDDSLFEDLNPKGEQIHWLPNRQILFTYHKTRIDAWSYDKGRLQHLWYKTYVEQYPEPIIGINDDFIAIYYYYNNGINFFDTQTGNLIYTLKSGWDCANYIKLSTDPRCQILADLKPLKQQVVSSSNPNLQLSDFDNKLIQHNSPRTHFMTIYDLPWGVTNYNSEWQINENGDVLLAFNARLYNLTQDRVVMEIPRYATGTSPYYTPKITLLNDDLTRLISYQSDESLYPHIIDSVIRVWSVNPYREVYMLNIFGENRFQFYSDMQWLFVFGQDRYMGGGQTMFFRDLDIYNGLTGDYITTLPTYGENAYSAQFSPDNRLLITQSDTLRVWAVVPDDETP